nr:HAD-IA family hydrolase [Streptococcus sp. DD11]
MKGMNYQDYIWDLGGTLLDNYETSTAAFVHTLQKFGKSAGHDEVYRALKVSTDYAVQQFASQEKDFLQLYKASEAEELEHPVLFDGAAELLERIVDKGGRNFLISHRGSQVWEILSKTGIAAAFTEVVTADNGFERKPSPASMLYLKDKYRIAAGLVIGDRSLDMEAGQAAGFDTYLFDSMQHLEEFIAID